MQTDCFPTCEIWKKGPIGMLARVNPRYPVETGHTYPFVPMAAVAEDFGGIQSFESRPATASGLSRFTQSDTLFAKITPCTENGKVAFVGQLPGALGLGSTEFIVLVPREGTDPRFLFHLLCSDEVRGRAVARMEGSTGRQRVPTEVFTKRLLVPIPSPEEQRAVALILDAVDESSRRTRQALASARRLKRALTQTLLVDGTKGERKEQTPLGRLPVSWRAAPLRQVVAQFQYGLSIAMEGTGPVPILRMGNIQDGDVRLDDLKYVALEREVFKSYLVRRGDVLFNRTNSQEWVGKVAIYRSDLPVVFASYLIRLVHTSDHIDPYFLGHVLNSYQAQCRIKRYATPGVQQVNINATNLGKVLIPLPAGPDGLTEQRKIASILEATSKLVATYERVLAAQQQLKRSLAREILTGRARLKELAAAAS